MRALLLTAVVVVAMRPAQAADETFARGIDLVPNKLTPTMDSGWVLDGAELRLQRSWQVRALFDLNFGILGLKLGAERLPDLVPFRADLHILAAYQVLPRLEVGGDLPITFVNVSNFQQLADRGFPQPSPRMVGLGSPRLLGRVQILRQSEIPIVSLAGVAEVRLPIGDGDSFMSDRGLVFSPRLAAERRIGPVRVLGNLGWRFRTVPGRYLNLYVGQEFLMGAGAVINLPDVWKFRQLEFLGEVNLATPAEAPFTLSEADALKTPFELLVGARALLKEHLGLELGIGRGLGASGYGREAFRLFIGLRWDVAAELDSDGDGIPDRIDQCPTSAAPGSPDGCIQPEADSDSDGVPDTVDACPTEAGRVEYDGCPDRDGDTIPDNVDKCPDEPGPADRAGCPPPEEEEQVVLESERIRINNQILFEFGSAVIDPRSFPLLDEVVKVLKDNPDVGPVLIEGHTDNVGTRPYNLDLSRRRAKSVEDYLASRGIARQRLRSDGFGFDRPVVPNDSPMNRAKNRRTEFKLVETEEGPDPAPTTPSGPPPPANRPRPEKR